MTKQYWILIVVVLVLVGIGLLYFPQIKSSESIIIDPATETALHLPPDPGEAGKQTLAGIDSDRDGVRDDVQRFVTVTYRSSQRTVAAGLQFAKALQGLMLTPTVQTDAAETKAINCFWSLYGESSGAIEDAIEAQQLNTDQRRAAMIAADSMFNGHLLDLGDQSNRQGQCTFDVTSLQN